eukprot:7384581-Prymnesium_polylepis.2
MASLFERHAACFEKRSVPGRVRGVSVWRGTVALGPSAQAKSKRLRRGQASESVRGTAMQRSSCSAVLVHAALPLAQRYRSPYVRQHGSRLYRSTGCTAARSASMQDLNVSIKSTRTQWQLRLERAKTLQNDSCVSRNLETQESGNKLLKTLKNLSEAFGTSL